MLQNDQQLRELLRSTRRIAVVGMSDKPDRPSHYVAQFMRERGFTIIPVNPQCTEIDGLKCYPSLRDIPGPIDMVNVFRRPDDIPPIARDAVAIGAKSLWIQLGLVSAEAEAVAEAAGLAVVMDQCIKVEYARLFEAPQD
ncbi:MAG: CoA-binding protein [Pseudazoarcus pumilus]|nr:CoA-binding protein [Pseudazoarcus pumilus]